MDFQDPAVIEKRKRIIAWSLAITLVISIAAIGVLSWTGVIGDVNAIIVSTDSDNAKKLREDILTTQQQYQDTSAKGIPSPELVERLSGAIEKQRDWLRMTDVHTPEETERLRLMEQALEKASGIEAKRASHEAEELANKLFSEKKTDEGIRKLREALDGQIVINRAPLSANIRNVGREMEISRRLEMMEVEPLVRTIVESTERAQKAVDQKNWPEALRSYQLAYDTQGKINREFARTTHASSVKLAEMERQLASFGTAELFTQGEENAKQAQQAQSEGRYEEAVSGFSRAIELQSTINRDFPRSRFASVEILQRYESDRQTAASEPRSKTIREMEAQIGKQIAEGDFSAAREAIREINFQIDHMTAEFPRSKWVNVQQRLRFSYLSLLKEDLEKIVRLLDASLLPVPGKKSTRMYRNEVSQELYRLVLGSNPSQTPVPQNAVDSVRWTDATDFCQRIGWILGKTVRLPWLDEFLAASALKKENVVEADELSSLVATPRAAASVGHFEGLNDGLAEWLHGIPTDTRVNVIGTRTGASQLTRVQADRYKQSPHVGFRFVVVD